MDNKNNKNNSEAGQPSGSRKAPSKAEVICLLDDDDDGPYVPQSFAPPKWGRRKNIPPPTSADCAITIDDSSDEEGQEEEAKKSDAPPPVAAAKASPVSSSRQEAEPRRGTLHDLWQTSRRPSKNASTPVPDSNASNNRENVQRKNSMEHQKSSRESNPTDTVGADDDERKPAALNPLLFRRKRSTAKKSSQNPNHPNDDRATSEMVRCRPYIHTCDRHTYRIVLRQQSSSSSSRSGPMDPPPFAASAQATCIAKREEEGKSWSSSASGTRPRQQAVGSKREREPSRSDVSDCEDSAFEPEHMSQPETSQSKRPSSRPKRQRKELKLKSNQKQLPELSDSLVEGARVLARFPMETAIGDDFFWGEITRVFNLRKGKQYYSVRFDDGDVRDEGKLLRLRRPRGIFLTKSCIAVPSKEIMSEQTYVSAVLPNELLLRTLLTKFVSSV